VYFILASAPVLFLQSSAFRHGEDRRISTPVNAYINKKFWEDVIAYVLWYDTDDIENDASNNYSVACIRCRGNVFTEPLPSDYKGDADTDTQTDGRDLWSTPLGWTEVPWYTYQVS
jgi:hypothetical protein